MGDIVVTFRPDKNDKTKISLTGVYEEDQSVSPKSDIATIEIDPTNIQKSVEDVVSKMTSPLQKYPGVSVSSAAASTAASTAAISSVDASTVSDAWNPDQKITTKIKSNQIDIFNAYNSGFLVNIQTKIPTDTGNKTIPVVNLKNKDVYYIYQKSNTTFTSYFAAKILGPDPVVANKTTLKINGLTSEKTSSYENKYLYILKGDYDTTKNLPELPIIASLATGGGSKSHKKTLSKKKQPRYKKQKSMRKW